MLLCAACVFSYIFIHSRSHFGRLYMTIRSISFEIGNQLMQLRSIKNVSIQITIQSVSFAYWITAWQKEKKKKWTLNICNKTLKTATIFRRRKASIDIYWLIYIVNQQKDITVKWMRYNSGVILINRNYFRKADWMKSHTRQHLFKSYSLGHQLGIWLKAMQIISEQIDENPLIVNRLETRVEWIS